MTPPNLFAAKGNYVLEPSDSFIKKLEKNGIILPRSNPNEDLQLDEWRRIKHEGKLKERRKLLSNPNVAKLLSDYPPSRGPFELQRPGIELQRSSFQVEFEWISLILEANKGVISEYAKKRNSIDEALFEGRFGEAQRCLEQLVKQFGWSFSALERHITLLASSSKHEELSRLFTDTISSTSNSLQQFFTAAIIYKSNPVVPATYFDKLFTSNLKLVNAPEPIKNLLRLLIQSPDVLNDIDHESFSFILAETSSFAFFDVYEIVLAYLQCGDALRTNDQRITGAIRSIRKSIRDPRLEQFFANPSKDAEQWMIGRRLIQHPNTSSSIEEIRNLIFQGDVTQSFEVIKNWLKTQPRSPITTGLDTLTMVFLGDRTLDFLTRSVVQFDSDLKRRVDAVIDAIPRSPDLEAIWENISALYQGRNIFELLYFCRSAASAAIAKDNASVLSSWVINAKHQYPVALKAFKGDKSITKFLGVQRMMSLNDLPILIAYAFVCDSLMEVSIRIEEFLDSINITYPSELFDKNYKSSLNNFDVFIVEVCTFEQLQHLPAVGETEGEVISERIKLLHQVETNSEFLKNKIDLEVSKLVKLERLRSMEKIVEESRLRVDTGSLVKKLSHLSEDEAIWSESSGSDFSDLHLHMLGLFLLDEDHGLDAELSGRIRHGKISERLLSPFLSNHLVIEKDEPMAVDYFGGRTIADKHDALENATDIIRLFSENVTNYIENFANERAQLKIIDVSWQGFPGLLSAKSAPKGLICVSTLRERSFQLFRLRREQAASKDDIETVFDLLIVSIWEALEFQLAQIRLIISEELGNTLTSMLSSVEDDVKNILPDISLDPFHLCRSQIEQVCNEISRWFVKPAEELFPSSKFEDIFELSERAMEFSRWGSLQTEVEPSVRNIWIDTSIGGEVYELLLLLLTNAAKHGSRQEIRIFSIYRDSQNPIALYFSNLCGTEVLVNVEEACSLISRAREGGNKEALNREGKSGFRKMIRQLRKIVLSGEFEILACADGERFCVRIEAEFLRLQ